MTPEETALCIELMQQDAEAKEARERRAVRHARIAVACGAAAFWIVAAALGWSVWGWVVEGGVR